MYSWEKNSILWKSCVWYRCVLLFCKYDGDIFFCAYGYGSSLNIVYIFFYLFLHMSVCRIVICFVFIWPFVFWNWYGETISKVVICLVCLLSFFFGIYLFGSGNENEIQICEQYVLYLGFFRLEDCIKDLFFLTSCFGLFIGGTHKCECTFGLIVFAVWSGNLSFSLWDLV